MSWVEAFLRDIDARWKPTASEPVTLKLLGSVSLFLQTDYARGTRDGDVLGTSDITEPVSEQLLGLAGSGTALAERHRLYIDIVGRNVPLLSSDAEWHLQPISLANFRIETLSVVDVVVSKLKRFHGDDRADVRAMVEGGHVTHRELLQRFHDVVRDYRFDARAAEFPRMARNLNQAERDWFLVNETRFDFEDIVW